MFNTIKNALKTPDVRKRVLYTLLLIVIFRLGCYITVPGVDIVALNEAMTTEGIAGFINLISGGAFSRFSIFAMSITPYITASIVIQLLAMIIPSLERLTKEGGEEGKKKIGKYTRIVTVILALVESIGIYLSYQSTGIFVNPGFLTGALVVASLVGGTAFLIWLGEQIDSRGIGNGISTIIFVGIISGLPTTLVTIWNLIVTKNGFSTAGLITSIGILIGAIILVAGVVFVQQAERRVPVQYSKRVVGRKMVGAQSTHIPLKLVMAGVMPVIFASSFMTFPAMIIQIFNPDIATQTGFLAGLYKFSMSTSTSQFGMGYSIGNAIVYLLLILGFTFFYTYATFNPAEVSNNIKKNGGFVPGIRAGKNTADYINKVLKNITWAGAVFLALVAVLPVVCQAAMPGLSISFGGTSILIVVSVALETLKVIESQMVSRHYDGFLN